jgi:hypothetical protein
MDTKRQNISEGYTDKEEFTHYIDTVPMEQSRKVIKMICIGREGLDVICSPNDSTGVDSGVSHTFDTSIGFTINRNLILRMKGSFKMLGKGRTTYQMQKGNSQHFYKITDRQVVQKASSIQDLTEALNSVHYIQLQSMYNEMQLKSEINNIKVVTTRIVKTIMQQNAHLLGNILGESVTTRNLNEDIFSVIMCKRNSDLIEGNCVGELVYKDGDYVRRKESEMCISYHENDVNNMTIFEERNLTKHVAIEGKIDEEASEKNVWSWLVDYRYQSQQKDYFSSSNYKWFSDIFDKKLGEIFTPFEKISSFFSFVSSSS